MCVQWFIDGGKSRDESMLMRWVRVLPGAIMVLLISACTPLQTTTSPTAPVESRRSGQASPMPKGQEVAPGAIVPTRAVISPAQKAVSSLLQESWAYYRQGNYERSIAIAERAQRLDPQRGEVYLLLANSYFAQGESGLAEQLGQRGLSFSRSDVAIRHQLQHLLVQIRGAVL